MPIEDRAAAAQKVNSLLKTVLAHGGFRLKYRITAGEPMVNAEGIRSAEIQVELSGPDAPVLLARGGELLLALEHLAAKALRLELEEHDLISFDSQNFKALRQQELAMAAQVAVEKVRKTNTPYEFAPMSSRERRMIHMAMREYPDVRTESAGEGSHRSVIVYPKDYTGKPVEPSSTRGFVGRRR
jgi:spoIIIJ-associated protein